MSEENMENEISRIGQGIKEKIWAMGKKENQIEGMRHGGRFTKVRYADNPSLAC